MRTNTIRLPSGDHAGCQSLVPRVSRWARRPDALIVQIALPLRALERAAETARRARATGALPAARGIGRLHSSTSVSVDGLPRWIEVSRWNTIARARGDQSGCAL